MRRDSSGIWIALDTPAGAATLHLRVAAGVVEATAWGNGAELAITQVPALCGADDDETGIGVLFSQTRERLEEHMMRLLRTQPSHNPDDEVI